MFCDLRMRLLLAGVMLAGGMPGQVQDRRSRIDVEQYTIDAEISPDTQSLTPKAARRFRPIDGNITSASSELNNKQTAGDKNRYQVKFERPSFPGSIAVVKAQPAKVASEGVNTSLYFRGAEAEMAQPYGEHIGKAMSYFTGMFGLPPYANLT